MESSNLTVEERVKYALFEALSTPSGRLVMLWSCNLLEDGPNRPFVSEPHQHAFNEGYRRAGQDTLAFLKSTHPQLYTQMMRELLDIQLHDSLQEET